MKEFQLKLDLVQETNNEPIYIKKDDVESVKFIFEIRNDDEVFSLEGATSVRLAIQRPSGLSFFQECVITESENGKCEATLTNQAYSEEGLVLGEIYITKGTVVNVTRQFEFKSLGSILAEGTNTGTGDGTVYWNDILSKPSTFPPSLHTHLWADITDKPTVFQPAAHNHDWAEIANKPTTFAPAAHGHDWTEIANKPATYTPTAHTHAYTSLTGIPTSFPPETHAHTYAEITQKPTSFPPEAHAHAITDITGLSAELDSKLEAIPLEYLTETEGDARYELKGAGTGTQPRTGTVDPTGLTPNYIGEIYINTTSAEAWIANSATGDWQTISADELGGAGTVAWIDVTDKPLTFPPSAHTHTTADVDGLDTTLSNKSNVGHAHTWTEITEKPTVFDPAPHLHNITHVRELDTELAARATKPLIGTAAPAIAPEFLGQIFIDDTNNVIYIADGTTSADWKNVSSDSVDWANILNKPATFTPSAHVHAIADVTNLEATLNELDKKPLRGTGAPAVTPEYVAQMYLDEATGDAYIANGLTANDWRLITNQQGSESVAWGSITGTLTNQLDLNDALNGKANANHAHGWAEITEKPTTFTPSAHTHLWGEITDKPTTFTPNLMSGSVTGGAKVGNGLTMAGANFDYLTIREGVAINVNPTTYALDVDKATTDTWYARNAEGQSNIIWKGTQAEYDALGTYDANTIYFIT